MMNAFKEHDIFALGAAHWYLQKGKLRDLVGLESFLHNFQEHGYGHRLTNVNIRI